MEQPQGPVDDHILVSPIWLRIIRIAQFVVSIIIVGLAASLIHDASLDEEALALAIAVITWFVVLYAVLTERVPTLRQLYHVIAILVLDGLMLVLWLATFAAVAAKRSKFKFTTRVSGCINTGSLFDSKFCFKAKRELSKRGGDNVILFKRGLDELSAIAGLGALVWLLFIASFAWTLWAFLEARKQGRFQFASTQPNTQGFQMEPKVEQQIQQQQQQIQQLQIQQQQQQIQQLQQQAVTAQQPAVQVAPPQPQTQYPVSYPPIVPDGQYQASQQQAVYPSPYPAASPPPASISPDYPAVVTPPPQPHNG